MPSTHAWGKVLLDQQGCQNPVIGVAGIGELACVGARNWILLSAKAASALYHRAITQILIFFKFVFIFLGLSIL